MREDLSDVVCDMPQGPGPRFRDAPDVVAPRMVNQAVRPCRVTGTDVIYPDPFGPDPRYCLNPESRPSPDPDCTRSANDDRLSRVKS